MAEEKEEILELSWDKLKRPANTRSACWRFFLAEPVGEPKVLANGKVRQQWADRVWCVECKKLGKHKGVKYTV